MATNIVNLGFKGTYSDPTADVSTFTTDNNNDDIFYFLGRNFNTTTWTNPVTNGQVNVTLINAQEGPANVLFDLIDNDQNLEVRPGPTPSPTASIIQIEFTNCRVQPTLFRLRGYNGATTSTYHWQNQVVDVSQDGSTWINIASLGTYVPTSGLNAWRTLYSGTDVGYFKYIRYSYDVQSPNSNGPRVLELNLYGNLYRDDGGSVGATTPVNLVEQLPKYAPVDLQDGDYLYYNSGIVTNRRKLIYDTTRLTMTGTLAIAEQYFPNFYILDPNGSTRNVDLPVSPLNETFLRFKTLDGLNAISIREPGPTTIATLNTATPVVDLYYENSTWTVINYG